ncbi:DUF3304 domain-containing protein [Aquabacterium sp.]|jgi:hypothetical protein|uniref:DUF3304 domain-containing protein n=1 Tax=Aquabacterium sp. TaxID=1872578 RepID=UPI0039B7309A
MKYISLVSCHRFAWLRVVTCASPLLLIMGCSQAQVPSSRPVVLPPEARLTVDAKSLLIQGYNYTDDYIHSFTVDGQGGGNLYVSGPTSGGGGSVCCASFSKGSPLPIRLKIRWVAAYCMWNEPNPYPYGQRFYNQRISLWREAEALAVDLSQGKPRALEVHIFPDGHVEAAITQGHSRPRMVLPDDHRGLRPGVQHTYPDCTDDQLKHRNQ